MGGPGGGRGEAEVGEGGGGRGEGGGGGGGGGAGGGGRRGLAALLDRAGRGRGADCCNEVRNPIRTQIQHSQIQPEEDVSSDPLNLPIQEHPEAHPEQEAKAKKEVESP